MGKDSQPKHRQQDRDLRRRAAVRQPYERLLIVCEGEKTEPQYLDEIRQELRLATAHVQVRPSGFGTEPLQVVEFAEHLFRHGDRAIGVAAQEFDRVIAVFDRDDHRTYHAALAKAEDLNERLTNDERRRIPFEAVPSVPCFELWLLLHFEDIQAPIHRNEVYERLRKHLPDYDKGQPGHWAKTKDLLGDASERAQARAEATSAFDGEMPYTGMSLLVGRLLHLKD
jgi:hypothetical protein